MAGDRTFGEKTTSISNSLESGVKRSVARLKLLSEFCTRSGLFKISGFNDSSLCIRQDKHALSGWEGYEEWGLITYSLGAAFTKPTTAKAPFPPAALGLTSFVPKYTSFVLSAQPVAWCPAAKDKKRCFFMMIGRPVIGSSHDWEISLQQRIGGISINLGWHLSLAKTATRITDNIVKWMRVSAIWALNVTKLV
jgi:hypothetical protein